MANAQTKSILIFTPVRGFTCIYIFYSLRDPHQAITGKPLGNLKFRIFGCILGFIFGDLPWSTVRRVLSERWTEARWRALGPKMEQGKKKAGGLN
jgi:hypothetical protein